ncbi:MAG: ABC transporter permease, partial [Bacteroidetes bacterium]
MRRVRKGRPMRQWIERQRVFIDFTAASLWRRKRRNLSLLALYILIVALLASVVFFTGSLRYQAGLLLREAPELVVQRNIAGRHDLVPLEWTEKIRGIRGVRSVQGRLWGYYYHPASKANYTLMVPPRFGHAEQDAVVGSGVLRTWRTAKGRSLFVRAWDGQAVELRVAGVLEADSELVAADLILVGERTFRRITGVPEGLVTDLAVAVRNPREAPKIAEKITAALAGARPILREEMLRTYASVFDWRSGYVLVVLSSVVLTFLIFAWDKASGLTPQEKTEIGILKAVGWTTEDVLLCKFWEALLVA